MRLSSGHTAIHFIVCLLFAFVVFYVHFSTPSNLDVEIKQRKKYSDSDNDIQFCVFGFFLSLSLSCSINLASFVRSFLWVICLIVIFAQMNCFVQSKREWHSALVIAAEIIDVCVCVCVLLSSY